MRTVDLAGRQRPALTGRRSPSIRRTRSRAVEGGVALAQRQVMLFFATTLLLTVSPPAVPRERLARLLGLGTSERMTPPARLTVFPCRLRGTVMAQQHQWSFAMVECERQTARVEIGDQVSGALVVEILHGAVIVMRDGREERLTLAAPDPSPPPPRGARTEKLATVFNDVSVMPAFRQGVAVGLKVLRVRPGSWAARQGLTPGDVLKTINGHAVGDPAALLELLPQLNALTELTVAIEHEGALQERRVSLTE